ncbi:MAG: hypothetical protein ACJ73D_01630 [Pyrinomonadaceae bacterium]
MKHLVAYLSDLAIIFGEEGNVHFDRLEDGCTMPVIRVDREATPKVRTRIRSVKLRIGPPEAIEAWKRVDERLRKDNSDGYILAPGDKKVLIFPGIRQRRMPEFGPVTQPDVLEGVPIKVGGEKDWVPVHLEDRNGEITICHAKRNMAKDMARHLFTTTIRVEGNGRWLRSSEGEWELIHFSAYNFKPISDRTLREDIDRLRSIEGEWKSHEDPLHELEIIRHEGEIQ